MADSVLVIGAGYVGTPTAALLAAHQMIAEPSHVTLADINEARTGALVRIRTGHEGEEPAYLGEPKINGVLRQAGHRLVVIHYEAGTDGLQTLRDLIHEHEVIVLCVGTPAHGRSLDHETIVELVRQTAWVAEMVTMQRKLVVIRSTVDPEVVKTLVEVFGAYVDIAVVPEFLREGYAVTDSQLNHRIVIGCDDQKLAEQRVFPLFTIRDLYSPELMTMLPHEAAAVKVLGNTLLAMKVSVANLIHTYAARAHPLGDGSRIVDAIGTDKRIGPAFMRPGLGPGGPCLPKDSGLGAGLLGVRDPLDGLFMAATRNPVSEMVDFLVEKTSLFIGLGFKPDSPDMRESAAWGVFGMVTQRNAQSGIGRVYAWDPRLDPDELEAQVKDHNRFLVSKGENGPVDIDDIFTTLFEQVPTDWSTVVILMDAKVEILPLDGQNRTVLDPYALCDRYTHRVLVERGYRYIGAGRGERFTEWP